MIIYISPSPSRSSPAAPGSHSASPSCSRLQRSKRSAAEKQRGFPRGKNPDVLADITDIT